MVIAIDAHRIAYMALPKAGCSSVKAALARIDPTVTLPPPEARDVNTWHAIYPTRRFRPHRWEVYDSYFRFAIIRDPVERLLSVYTNRVVDLKELHNSRKIRRGRVDLPRDPDPDFFFSHLSRYCAASSVIKHHCLGAEAFIGPRPLRYDRIYKSSELAEFARDVTSIARQPCCVPRENQSRTSLSLGDLAPDTLGALRDFLDRQYALLSGFYDNPL